MYGSDLWAGGNRKRRHVGNQTAVCGGRGHEPGSDKSASVKYTSVENNSKTSDAVFISHCLDVYLSVRRGRQRRMGKKNYAMCFVLCRLWDEAWNWMHSPEMQQMTCRRIKIWRTRESVCGQTLANASSAAYTCSIHFCKSADAQREEGILLWQKSIKKSFYKSWRCSSPLCFVDPAENRRNKNKMSSDNSGFRAVNIPHIIRLPNHQVTAVPARRRKKRRRAHIYSPGSPNRKPVSNRKTNFRKSNSKLKRAELIGGCGRKISSRSDAGNEPANDSVHPCVITQDVP